MNVKKSINSSEKPMVRKTGKSFNEGFFSTQFLFFSKFFVRGLLKEEAMKGFGADLVGFGNITHTIPSLRRSVQVTSPCLLYTYMCICE